jgi:spermidine/putrescine transport system ATP-binding protein
MADSIAVMNRGRIEQLGPPDELYERPSTVFVAGFLGVSNLLHGTVVGEDSVQLDAGGEIRVSPRSLGRRSGRVAVGVRPEKICLGPEDRNRLEGRVTERAYLGVAIQYVVETAHGPLQVYVQNAERDIHAVSPGDAVTLSFSPDAAFAVDPAEEVEP